MVQLNNDDWLYIDFMLECRDELVYMRTQELEQLNNGDWLYIASVVECRDELVYMRENKRLTG